ncbi:MAG TPA: S8 family serine peptidase, partial [Anaeromyxobacter sp.]|nr:S8 family serine peptidase [Anaeromyxobacter sp.]
MHRHAHPSASSLVPLVLPLLAAAAVAFPAAAGAQAAAGRFTRIDGPPDGIEVPMPANLGPNARVKVVLRLASDPVATARARVGGRLLSRSEEDAVVARTHAEHAAVEPGLAALGGRVLARYSHALNGLKVEVARRDVSRLAALPGVVEVLPVVRHHLDNAVSVPFIGAPGAWGGTPAFRGEGMKIAIIDTGIDYTHANFGGPGTVAAWTTAFANSTLPPDPTLFGCPTCKVKGGTDLVGDAYNADDPTSVPVPDPNPLDCNSHGSHVAGTAAGYGVAGGTTYRGPYDTTTYSTPFDIGPGVAPLADLYAVRVFGCAGSTDVVTEALDWAVQHQVDVISMSLGSDFGPSNSSDAVASANAVKAGILVVAASGNAGPTPYITSSPASGNGVVAAAAMDATRPTYPAATLALGTGQSITAQDSNGAPVVAGTAYDVVVLRNPDGTVSLGCDEAEYVDSVITGKLVVTVRGTCNRVYRAQYGQKHGAAAVAMINTSSAYPPFEGAIPFDPATGLPAVTIPFLGVRGVLANPASDGSLLAGQTTATLSASTTIPNPTYQTIASFSSGGPRLGDGVLKPSATAPGVNIVSTGMGTGNGSLTDSGTSMATPHVAGALALSRQAHPGWSAFDQRAAVVQTAAPSLVVGYDPRLAGAGVIQPASAVHTQAVVEQVDETGLSFGVNEASGDLRLTRVITLRNHGGAPVTFVVSSTQVSTGPGVTVTTSRGTVALGPHDDEDLRVTLTVPAGAISPTHDPVTGADVFQDISGFLTFTPASPSQNGGISLRVPYYLVPRVRSNLFAVAAGAPGPRHRSTPLFVSNFLSPLAAQPDFYAWGLSSPPSGVLFFDPRAVGVQTNPISATDSILVFAVNTWQRFSWADLGYVEMDLNTAGSPAANYAVVAADLGLLTGAGFVGSQFAV